MFNSFVRCQTTTCKIYLQKIVNERFQAEAFQKEEDRSKVADCLCAIKTIFKESDWPAKLALFSLNYPSSTF